MGVLVEVPHINDQFERQLRLQAQVQFGFIDGRCCVSVPMTKQDSVFAKLQNDSLQAKCVITGLSCDMGAH